MMIKVYKSGLLRQRGAGGEPVVYKSGILRQRGAGRWSGLLDTFKSVGKSLWSAGKEAVKKNAMQLLPKVGQNVLDAVSGRKKWNWKKVAQDTLRPAVTNTVSDALKNVVTSLEPIKDPVSSPSTSLRPTKRKKQQKERKKSSSNKRRRPDIFEYGLHPSHAP